MGKLREIDTRAQFAFSPISTLIATGTIAASLDDDLSAEARIEIYDPKLDSQDTEAFTLKPLGAVTCEQRCISLAWGGISTERPQGIIVAASDGKVIDLWDATAIMNGADREAALIKHATAHTGQVKCIDFSTVQPNLLASAGTKGEFFVWDTARPAAAPTAYKSNRLDEIISLAWNKKVGHIIALGGRSGALSVWDLKKKSELIHIPTRVSVSSIAWHPTEATILISASSDDKNPIIQVWDLRNANAPKMTLSGHDKGVLSLSWCTQDPELLLSSGTDNRTLIWNPATGAALAELPASSQWVHQVSWCKRQPHILANATLDGKVSIYSIQDTTSPVQPTIAEDVPAGDDFFDSIPNNFQAQTTSFTLKQPPRWLRRTSGVRFGFGGRLTTFKSGSMNVELSTQPASSSFASIASQLKQNLAEQSIKELCEAQSADGVDTEKQEWEIIQTLTAEHARDALRTYLGFTKEEVEDEISIADTPAKEVKAATAMSVDEEMSKPETGFQEASVFGEAGADDDFMGIINSEAPSTNGEVKTDVVTKQTSFEIFGKTSLESDKLITRAIFTGQFDRAIDICLKEDRMSDAFMLALCGGTESQKRVQAAYFAKTSVPYGRLLSSIVAGDLVDVAEHAELGHWKEILAIVCNYAKPDDFLKLCEILGKRLENSGSQRSAAILCYLAGERLDHLVPIWLAAQEQHEREALTVNEGGSPFELHVDGLSKLIRKISIYRKAVSFVDPQSKTGERYTLSALYSIYLEYAHLLADQGELSLAADYLALIPSAYDGAEALKKRVSGPVKSNAQSAQRTTGMRPTGMRNVYTQPASEPEPALPLPANRAPTAYSAQGQAAPNNLPIASSQQATTAPRVAHNPYAPVNTQMTNGAIAKAPVSVQQPYQPSQPQQSAYQPVMNGQYNATSNLQSQSQFSSFAPPPSRIASASDGPAILPAAQRKDITPWNDAPDIPLPAPRRATPAINRSAITSPFQPAANTPTLQSFGPPQPQPLAPPPKTRSPAPPRAASSSGPAGNPSQTGRAPSSAYAPSPQAQMPPVGAVDRAPSNAYAPPTNQYAMNSHSQYNAAPTLPPQQHQVPQQRAPIQPVNHAPPPIAFAPPPRVSSGPPKSTGPPSAGPPAGLKSPIISRNVNLSPEPSRQNSPVQERFEFPQARYPPGDRSHMPESDRPIEHDLSNLLAHLQSVAPENYRKPLENVQKRFGILFDQLNNTQLTDGTREQLRMTAAAFRTSDWATAWAIHGEMAKDKMHECREWITGIKVLVVLGKKSIEEQWH